jgi:hypothetical protein
MTDWQYGGVHFGLFSIYEWPNDFSEGKTTDHVKRHERDVINTYLGTSRDAVHWDLSTIYAGKPLIERGGANERHGVAEIFQPKRDLAIGLAKLPLDRFAGLNAGERPGTIVTKPFKLSTSEIALNADARNGDVTIDVLDGVTLINSDEMVWRAEWKSPEFVRRVGQMVRLRFRLRNATLYAFRVGV